MYVVLAHTHDQAAWALVERWAPLGAGLLTPQDLSKAGWTHRVGNPRRSTAVINGHLVTAHEISGVLTRLPAVIAQELVEIVAEERPYAAAEMTAFLLAWLCELECPVLNRPSPTSLTGPSWRPEQWRHVACRLGINIAPVHRHVTLSEANPSWLSARRGMPVGTDGASSLPVTVIGRHCIGAVDDALAYQARLLADAAGVDLLVVHFSGAETGSTLVAADFWPDVSQPEVADAILEYLKQ